MPSGLREEREKMVVVSRCAHLKTVEDLSLEFLMLVPPH